MDDLISRQAAIAYAISGRIRTLPTTEDGENWIRVSEVRESLIAMPSAQQWIPCSEGLPEEGVVVVTVDKDGDYEINAIIDEEDCEWFWEKPVAWMPLPKPYERKES